MPRPKALLVGVAAVAAVSIGLVALWTLSHGAEAPPALHIAPAGYGGGKVGTGLVRASVIADDLRLKYSPAKRVEFQVTSSRDTSIFVLATGVQVRTSVGWQVAAEEYRGEVWRLTNGVARELCVERPEAATWRAYVRYGTEMKGATLLRARIKEAWRTRSFANWTGKAWGGGRWSGSCELLSHEIGE